MVGRLKRFWGEERSLTALLALLIVEMFLIAPTSRAGNILDFIGGFIFSLLLLAGLLNMARQRVIQVAAGIFIVSAIAMRFARLFFGVSGLFHWEFLLTLISIAGMVVVVLWQVYRDGPVTGHRVRGAIAAYLLIAVLFAYCYMLIDYLTPGSFQLPGWVSQSGPERRAAFLYFSTVTLTTVGFGDITAVHPFARSLVMLEALIGPLFPAILIARLVSLEIETRRSRKG